MFVFRVSERVRRRAESFVSARGSGITLKTDCAANTFFFAAAVKKGRCMVSSLLVSVAGLALVQGRGTLQCSLVCVRRSAVTGKTVAMENNLNSIPRFERS